MPKLVHDSTCQEPLNQHTGNETCIVYVDDPVPPPAHPMMRGPQGNLVPDHHTDFINRYGKANPKKVLGSPDAKDRRDNRDPAEIGRAFLARSNGE